MIKSFFSTLFRQLWRNRLFSSLNILGLAIALCAAWIIFRMVAFEHSYDKKIPQKENVYQLYISSESDGNHSSFAGVAKGILSAMQKDITGLELVVPTYYQYHEKVAVASEQGIQQTTIKPSEKQISTSIGYFEMLGFEWEAGDNKTAFNDPNAIVLDTDRAAVYFPGEAPQNIIGKTITFNDTIPRKVTGIVKPLNYINSFNAHEFIPTSTDDIQSDVWDGYSSNDLMFIRLLPGVKAEQVLAQLNKLQTEKNKEDFEKYNSRSWYEAAPISKRHFMWELGANTRTADSKVLRNLIIVGLFLLVLGCINYINLSTAQLPQRAREIGIRKTLGSTPKQLILRFLLETLVITVFAALLAVLLAIPASGWLKDFMPRGMDAYNNYGLLAAIITGLIIIVTLLSGLYPAYLITRIPSVQVLKGQLSKVIKPKRITLRKGLIVFQFIVAQFFIIAAIIIGQQLRYTMQKDLGFKKEAIITFDIPYEARNKKEYKERPFVLKDELQKISGIENVALGARPMHSSMMSNLVKVTKDTGVIQKPLNLKFVDTSYIALYGMELIAGRNLSPTDTINEYIINETAVSAFGWASPEDAIGQFITTSGGNKSSPVVGVVKDYHQFGFRSKIGPAALLTSKGQLAVVNIKLQNENAANWRSTLDAIEKKWNELYPDFEWTYQFYDETIKSLYEGEEKTSNLVKLATGIAIFISCLGLFGLATLTTYQKAKEIGIRKVLGATVSNITTMISREFVILIIFSIIIASPIAWWVMNSWLADFTFKIDIQWWTFLLAAIIAIVIALLTVSFQSIKAAVANPVKSLRDE